MGRSRLACRPMTSLDLAFVRSQFPAFQLPGTRDWAHLENAGGSYVPNQVIDRLLHFYRNTKTQPYWAFGPSQEAGEAMDLAKARLPATFNAEPVETHFGPSTTQNVYVLAHALRQAMTEGDEVVVTNQDHEANVGAWRRLADTGIVVREWQVDPTTGLLDPTELSDLLTDRTKVVAVTHASNLAATRNPIADIATAVHAHGGVLVVDGVSHAPHAAVDVQALGCDVYLYSAYKTFGPHLGMMYVAEPTLASVANQGHFFNEHKLDTRLVPAGPNHAEIAASAGIMAYYDAIHAHHFDNRPANDVELVGDVFELFGQHEEALMAPLIDDLADRADVQLVGSASTSHAVREPTVAFWSPKVASREIYDALVAGGVACGHGHFYSRRLVTALGLDPDDGVVRLSMVHYNTHDEVARALDVLDQVL